jgi:gluconolactonase
MNDFKSIHMRITFTLFAYLLLFACNGPQTEQAPADETAAETPQYKTIGGLEKLDPWFDSIVPPTSKIEVLAEGYTWSEGPLWLEETQTLIWSDVPENRIFSWKEGEQAQLYLHPSGNLAGDREGEEGSNGLLLNANGELVLCQHGDRRMAKMDAPVSAPKPTYVTLADKYDGQRFNSPNDAAYDKDGHLYFTDPPYGLPKQMDDPEKEMAFQGVYRLAPDGQVTLLTDELTRPNGIAFSPDFSKCYVANSDPNRAIWMVYDVTPDKIFTNGKVFFDATQLVPNNKGLPDGLKVRSDGTLFATGPGGVFVFSPDGKHLGTIHTGQATANCCFNKDESVLFMTADMYVARIILKGDK